MIVGEEKKKADILSPAWIIPAVPLLFLFIGFLYVKFYYGYFGIPSIHYFNLQDYLSVSIDSYISYFCVLIFLFLQRTRDYAQELLEKGKPKGFFRKIWEIIRPFPYGISVTLILAFFVFTAKEGILFALYWVFLGAIFSFNYAIFIKKIKPVLPEEAKTILAIVLVVVPLLIGGVYLKAHADISTLLYESSRLKQFIIKEKTITSDKVRIIGTNSHYIFLYDLAEQRSIVTNINHLTAAEYKSKKELVDIIDAKIRGPVSKKINFLKEIS